MSSLARLIEAPGLLQLVDTTQSTDPISLEGADKFSIQVTAIVGNSIAHLEGSNDGVTWTEVDNFTINEGQSDIFEQPNCSYLEARITLENNDIADVAAELLILVIGDAL